jgi:hypothetical protein
MPCKPVMHQVHTALALHGSGHKVKSLPSSISVRRMFVDDTKCPASRRQFAGVTLGTFFERSGVDDDCPQGTLSRQENTAMTSLMDLRQATLAARVRTNDQGISTRVEAGRVQVVRVHYPAGNPDRAVVTPITDFLPSDAAVRALEALRPGCCPVCRD